MVAASAIFVCSAEPVAAAVSLPPAGPADNAARPGIRILKAKMVMARPYPIQYVKPWQMKDGEQIVIRPICPEDEARMVPFHESLSDQSVYFRYFHMISLDRRVDHDRLARICFVDYYRSMALIAERNDRQIIAVGRLVRDPIERNAELAVVVSDAFQNRGLGSELVKRLVEIARVEKCSRVDADILPENTAMQHVFRNAGFQLNYTVQDGTKATIVLDLA